MREDHAYGMSDYLSKIRPSSIEQISSNTSTYLHAKLSMRFFVAPCANSSKKEYYRRQLYQRLTERCTLKAATGISLAQVVPYCLIHQKTLRLLYWLLLINAEHSNFQDVPFGVCPFLHLQDTLALVLVHHRPPAILTTRDFKLTYTYGWRRWRKSSMIELQITKNFCSRNRILTFCITLLSSWTLPHISTCMIPPPAINPRVSTLFKLQ